MSYDFSGLYFPAFGLNNEISVFSPNAGKYGPEKSEYGHFLRSVYCGKLNQFWNVLRNKLNSYHNYYCKNKMNYDLL